jgi:very-short-patch-repair endonuclease
VRPSLVPEGPDSICARIAAGRHGVITRAEALAAGLSAQGIYRRVKSGAWRHLLPRTYGLAPGRTEWHQRLAALSEWCEGVASHRSAAALLSLDGYAPGALEVWSPKRRECAWTDASVYRASVVPADSTVVDGIRTTSATRTLVDLAATSEPDSVELALEDALRRGLTSLPRLRWALSVEGARGRPGAKLLRGLVSRLDAEDAVTESGFELRLHQLLRRAGLPQPVRQFEIYYDGRVVARADFAYPSRKLAIEGVSYRWHSGRSAWYRDQRRLNGVVALGWRVLNVTWEDLRESPDEIVERIRRALGVVRLFDEE